MNQVSLVGRITRDPELSFTASGTALCRLRLATNEWVASKQHSEFHDLDCWAAQAERLARYARKGTLLQVTGQLRTSEYTGQDGVKRRVTRIRAQQVELLADFGQGGETAPIAADAEAEALAEPGAAADPEPPARRRRHAAEPTADTAP